MQYQNEGFLVKTGRQRIFRNNQAMVGNVGWRVNEQTFDAVSLSYTGDVFETHYSYANRAQRIFGNDGDDAPPQSPIQNWEGNFHFFDTSMTLESGKLGGYAYLVDVDNNTTIGRNNTFGLYYQLNGLHLETAWQDGTSSIIAGDGDYDAMYAHIKYDKKLGGATYGAGFEYLEENFKTPFATVHAYNGFADAFILQRIGVTKAKGYEGLGDFYLSYTRPGLPWDCTFKGFAHYFVNDGLSENYGAEVDAALIKKFNDQLSAMLKVAFFFEDDGPGGFGDINQVTFQVDYSF